MKPLVVLDGKPVLWDELVIECQPIPGEPVQGKDGRWNTTYTPGESFIEVTRGGHMSRGLIVYQTRGLSGRTVYHATTEGLDKIGYD